MNTKKRGALIVIDGVDGAGKRTQSDMLFEKAKKRGIPIEKFSFPRYNHPSAAAIELYLQERIVPIQDIGPKPASVFFAIDRFFAKFTIEPLLESGTIVLLDRYVAANAGHQGGKIKNEEERAAYLAWLYDFEYNVMGIPRPDLNIILYLPPEIGQRRTGDRGKKDGHENDITHLQNAARSYLWLAENYPKDYERIEVFQNGRELTPEEVHELVWRRVERFL